MASLEAPGLGNEGGPVGQEAGCKRVLAVREIQEVSLLPACLLLIPLWASSAGVCNILPVVVACTKPLAASAAVFPLPPLLFLLACFQGNLGRVFSLGSQIFIATQACVHTGPITIPPLCTAPGPTGRLCIGWSPECRSPVVAHKGSLRRHPSISQASVARSFPSHHTTTAPPPGIVGAVLLYKETLGPPGM